MAFSDFEYDAIVFHSDDEYLNAEEFCNTVREKIGLERPLKMVTMEEFSRLGVTAIQDLEDAIDSARYIFCSEYYYHTDFFGKFSAHVAILEKLPDKMVKVGTGRTVRESSIMKAFRGLQLQENWEISDHEMDKLRKIFSSVPGGIHNPAPPHGHDAATQPLPTAGEESTADNLGGSSGAACPPNDSTTGTYSFSMNRCQLL